MVVEPPKVRLKSRPAEVETLKLEVPIVETTKAEPSVRNSLSPGTEEIPVCPLKVSEIHEMLMEQERTRLAESQRTPGTPVNQMIGMSMPLTKSATTPVMSPVEPRLGLKPQLTVVTEKPDVPKILSLA